MSRPTPSRDDASVSSATRGGLTRTRVRYTGRVQGVGFRATARDLASSFQGLSGWVRNEADGSVLLEVQATSEHARSFLDALRERMERRVVTTDESTIEPIVGERAFVIAR